MNDLNFDTHIKRLCAWLNFLSLFFIRFVHFFLLFLFFQSLFIFFLTWHDPASKISLFGKCNGIPYRISYSFRCSYFFLFFISSYFTKKKIEKLFTLIYLLLDIREFMLGYRNKICFLISSIISCVSTQFRKIAKNNIYEKLATETILLFWLWEFCVFVE